MFASVRKGRPPLRLHEVDQRPRPVRTQVREASTLAEMRLDRDELVLQVKFPQAGGLQEARELLLEVLRVGTAKIGEMDDGFLHRLKG